MKLLRGCPQCGQDLAQNLVLVDLGVFVCDICLREFTSADVQPVLARGA